MRRRWCRSIVNLELETPRAIPADARQERLLIRPRPCLYAMVLCVDDEDTIKIVSERKVTGSLELAWLVALPAKLGHERAIVTREHLNSMVVTVGCQQEAARSVEQ